jgi:hypothetical protein
MCVSSSTISMEEEEVVAQLIFWHTAREEMVENTFKPDNSKVR